MTNHRGLIRRGVHHVGPTGAHATLTQWDARGSQATPVSTEISLIIHGTGKCP